MKRMTTHKICRAIAGIGPVGNLPASGTWGSLIALPFAYLFWGSNWIFILIALSFLVGIITIRPLIKENKEKDPSFVIIDEFMGQLLTFSFMGTISVCPILLIFGFLFFRLFDILKPWPVSFFDRKVHSAFGVMADDFMAGLYASLGLVFLLKICYAF